MKNRMNIINKNGYYFNKETQRLENFELVKIFVNFHDETVVYHCSLGGKESIIEDANIQIYASENAFKRNTPNEYLTGGDFKSLFHRVYGFYPMCSDDGEYRAYTIINGQAELVAIKSMTFEIIYYSPYSCHVYTDSTAKYYADGAEVFEWNDYILLDSDGTTHRRECTASKLAMNDEQAALVAELDIILEKLNKANIKLLIDYDSYKVYALSMTNIDRLETYDDFNDDYATIQLKMMSELNGSRVSVFNSGDWLPHASFNKE